MVSGHALLYSLQVHFEMGANIDRNEAADGKLLIIVRKINSKKSDELTFSSINQYRSQLRIIEKNPLLQNVNKHKRSLRAKA